MMKLLLIDNFDSFTFNLFHLIYQTCQKNLLKISSFDVKRNDDPSLKTINSDDYNLIIIGPGPGGPMDTGFTKTVVEKTLGKIPLFGVCLGHQFLAAFLGAEITHATEPKHGKVSKIYHDSTNIFDGIANETMVARYHSLIINPRKLPIDFEVTAITSQNEIMAIQSPKIKAYGVQFHPESFLTQHGEEMIFNLFKLTQKTFSVSIGG